jgi:uncharacterized protein YvpB
VFIFILLPFSSRAAGAGSPPEAAYITGFVGHAQSYNLSCESRSAVDWAAFWGKDISESEFQARLPASDNPDVGYVGDWNGPWGYIPPYSYGVHAGPVAALLRQYGLRARAERGLEWDALRAEIAAGRPAIVWIIGAMWAGHPVEYTAADGQAVTVARYEHTMVLIGYDARVVHAVDAYTGWTQTYTLDSFLTSWSALGNMAVLGRGRKKEGAPLEPTPPAPAALQPPSLWLPVIHAPGGGAPPGQPVQPETYTVQRGDYLIALAQGWGLDWRDLAALNDIAYPWVIYPGQVLRLK